MIVLVFSFFSVYHDDSGDEDENVDQMLVCPPSDTDDNWLMDEGDEDDDDEEEDEGKNLKVTEYGSRSSMASSTPLRLLNPILPRFHQSYYIILLARGI